YMLYHCLLGNFVNPVAGYLITLFLFGLLWVFYYFFSKSWKRVTITATEIILYDVVFKKQITIAYADITHIATYRTQGYSRTSGRAFSQKFVIDFKDDQSVTLDEAWYNNYSKLTMAIYLHKYGPGHGRERYLERHGREA
ncbi:MAG TPA: hypothetical protein VGI43_06540, partial [Mucilaginibacter sp.]